MKKTLHALLLALVLVCTLCFSAAYAREDWSQATVTVAWTDEYGAYHEEAAQPVWWSDSQSYWVQLPQGVPQSMVTITVSHPGGYSFTVNGANQPVYAADAGSELNEWAAIMLDAYAGDSFVDRYGLFISSQPMPDQQSSYVPDTPIEVITPSAQVSIVYQTTDGMMLYQDSTVVTYGAPQSLYGMDFDGYTIASQEPVDVWVDELGNLTNWRALSRL